MYADVHLCIVRFAHFEIVKLFFLQLSLVNFAMYALITVPILSQLLSVSTANAPPEGNVCSMLDLNCGRRNRNIED